MVVRIVWHSGNGWKSTKKINKNVPDEYGFDYIRVIPALCFEGGNASGKSCALRVLSFIVDFCLNSFLYDTSSGGLYDTIFNNIERLEIK